MLPYSGNVNPYIIPIHPNDPRLLSHVSRAFSLVDLGKRLLEAAKNGDVEEVKNLIDNGAPFTTDWLGISPLHFAAMNGHLSSCEALLQAGMSRDARSKVERTPLHLAAQEGHSDIVELLLRNGAEIEAKDMLCMTALHWAAERGHAHVVQMLMRFGADATVENKFELTPLEIAERRGHLDAHEAMMNSNETVSSVGRMAATNADLANTNAYILTEEETLVPAAPPADEVIVTSTMVDESENDEKFSNGLSNGYAHSDTPQTEHDQKQSSHVNGSLSLPTLLEIDGMDPYETNGQDVMLVETPDGNMLHVRQLDASSGLDGLAIFTSTGERVESPSIMAQVIEAMAELSPIGDHSIHNFYHRRHHMPPTLVDENESAVATIPTGKESCGPRYRDSPPILSPQKHAYFDQPSGIDSGSNMQMTPSKLFSDSRHSDDSITDVVWEDGMEEDDQQSKAVLNQLAAFVDQADKNGEHVITVDDDMEPSASMRDLCNWCLYNGIFVQSFRDNSQFQIEFIHNRKAYRLNASYDAQHQAITFRRTTAPDI